MAWVIKDKKSGEYYRQRFSKNSWYSSDIDNARLYSDRKQAETTIKSGNHHVTYQGREPIVVKVKIAEV